MSPRRRDKRANIGRALAVGLIENAYRRWRRGEIVEHERESTLGNIAPHLITEHASDAEAIDRRVDADSGTLRLTSRRQKHEFSIR